MEKEVVKKFFLIFFKIIIYYLCRKMNFYEKTCGLGCGDVFTSEDRYEEVGRNYPVSGKGGNAGKSICFYPILEY